MKRFLCIALTVLLLFITVGCKKDSANFKEPANFYYKNAAVTFFKSDSVIAPEIRETVSISGHILEILNLYLCGPVSDDLVSPFPTGLKIINIEQSEETFIITFNEKFSLLSGLDQTVACSCICATVADLTGFETVEFKSEAPVSDENSPLVFTYDKLHLIDTVDQ